MTGQSPLTDLTARTAYAGRQRPDAMFLHETAAAEVNDRIGLVNRPFTQMAIVTPFTDFWSSLWPTATIVADHDTLALAQGSYDLVVHAMGLHWANDPVGQLIQCKRALKPDGLFIGVCFGGQTLQELRACLAEAEIAQTGGLSPRIAPMGEVRDYGGLLQRAGFALPVGDTLSQTASYRDTYHLMRDLRAMGEGNAMTARLRHTTKRALFADADARYLAAYGDEAGRIPATFDLVFLTGWAPDASQPQALRPGSAQARLADALNVAETPLPD